MGGHAFRRQNEKERLAALAERAQRGQRKNAKIETAQAGAVKRKKARPAASS
jgi:hypothetical protein